MPLSHMFALHELDTGAPPPQRELARRLGLEKSTLSRLVTDMEARACWCATAVPETAAAADCSSPTAAARCMLR